MKKLFVIDKTEYIKHFCYWRSIVEAGHLLKDMIEEKNNKYRKGIYGYTQCMFGYNSNKIEGSTLTEKQTASLFEEGVIAASDDYYKAKDIEEMNGHFLMFNYMLSTMNVSIFIATAYK